MFSTLWGRTQSDARNDCGGVTHMNRCEFTVRMAISSLIVVVVGLAQQLSPLGTPLPGVTSQELELFRAGRADFLEVESADDGLGPMFNGTSCAQCHNLPTVGGT